ncbi:phosphatase PAP2 family protein [Streptomyces chiangmaiensis]|uniref:Phosphatase PAP2 family protein n=1 Tax=Streptomyces chiangmaiensis TaxID=766497 RepID=A0ABU7FLY4_9ACTN|nr:hypothetical protein [Streptomyces chiangmaiensis]MED7824707.1 hypothetical protein [Streptomyces chiangmaiensis]
MSTTPTTAARPAATDAATASPAAKPHQARPVAHAISEWLHPKTWIVLVSLLTGWHAHRYAGLGWSLITILFAAVIPMLFIDSGIRRGRWDDRNVGARNARLLVMAVIIASVLIGIALIALFSGPTSLIALTVTMMTTLAILAVITVAWKISVHQAVSAGAVAIAAVIYGPWMLLGFIPVAVVGWSRIALRDHTPAQVTAGTIVGALVAGAVFAGLT